LIVSYTGPLTTTFTIPETAYGNLYINACGGGGAGGGLMASGNWTCGGGSAGGIYQFPLPISLIDKKININVGKGGSGVTTNTSGISGDNTTIEYFIQGKKIVITCSAGGGGFNATSSVGYTNVGGGGGGNIYVTPGDPVTEKGGSGFSEVAGSNAKASVFFCVLAGKGGIGTTPPKLFPVTAARQNYLGCMKGGLGGGTASNTLGTNAMNGASSFPFGFGGKYYTLNDITSGGGAGSIFGNGGNASSNFVTSGGDFGAGGGGLRVNASPPSQLEGGRGGSGRVDIIYTVL
jgi:hypothetical protein